MRSLSNTGGADVSIRTLGSRQPWQRNPRPRRQRLSQAAGIGNSVLIIDAEAELREVFDLDNGAPGISARQRDIDVRPISDQTRPVKLSP